MRGMRQLTVIAFKTISIDLSGKLRKMAMMNGGGFA
jgi:hypothetical protein